MPGWLSWLSIQLLISGSWVWAPCWALWWARSLPQTPIFKNDNSLKNSINFYFICAWPLPLPDSHFSLCTQFCQNVAVSQTEGGRTGKTNIYQLHDSQVVRNFVIYFWSLMGKRMMFLSLRISGTVPLTRNILLKRLYPKNSKRYLSSIFLFSCLKIFLETPEIWLA